MDYNTLAGNIVMSIIVCVDCFIVICCIISYIWIMINDKDEV